MLRDAGDGSSQWQRGTFGAQHELAKERVSEGRRGYTLMRERNEDSKRERERIKMIVWACKSVTQLRIREREDIFIQCEFEEQSITVGDIFERQSDTVITSIIILKVYKRVLNSSRHLVHKTHYLHIVL